MVTRKARHFWLILLAFLIAIVAFGGIVVYASSAKTLKTEDVEGVWFLSYPEEDLQVTFEQDGRFIAESWPSDLGCAADLWPTSLDEINWDLRERREGWWVINEIDSKSVDITPEPAECSSFLYRISPVLGDSSLRILLDINRESAVELVFQRER